ncbi:TRAP transporter substrate-binding protein [Allosediminivita pacifica]|uniref:TRAP-type C4-dicarboxylate transport system substrate-binding protein n=1 Tax=Allosediminivita pacifica TaxID=1267769 RepID=A0A2T6A931_9RHOB|nr:TRAP transporter substrate-binding protein DctP [Allosediminivita pacifica]PTX40289.1 TRAP-type C4-dicarboxylate transport system substrate-binding protein [Allosediminivita pacifica]GGB26567.1 ABC transporter substrate-binding protein [Allosediminivita pacifica]
MKNMIAAVTAASALTLSPVAQATTLTFAHGFNENHFWYTQIIGPMMDCIGTRTDKAITFDHFPGGTIVGHSDALDALNNGLTAITPVAIGYHTTEMPLNGIPMLPGLGTSSVQMTGAYRNVLDQQGAMLAEFTDHDVHPLVISMFSVYQLLLVGDPITSMEDLSGRVIRSAGGALTLTIDALDAAAAEIPITDLYVAMQNGTVDGALSGLSAVKPFALQEQVRSVSTNGAFGSFGTVLTMDLGTYETLSEDNRAAVDSCASEIEAAAAVYLDKENEELKSEFAALGITLFEFPNEMLSAIQARTGSVIEAYVSRLDGRGKPGSETLRAYEAALN